MQIFILTSCGSSGHFLLPTNLTKEEVQRRHPGYEVEFILYHTENDRTLFKLPKVEMSWTYK